MTTRDPAVRPSEVVLPGGAGALRAGILRGLMACADGYCALLPSGPGRIRLRSWIARLGALRWRCRLPSRRLWWRSSDGTFPLWASPASGVGASLWALGTFDAPGVQACIDALRERPEPVFLDIGANCGVFSLSAGLALRDVRVIAVEASLATSRLLRRNVAENAERLAQTGSRIEVEALALGDRDGEVRFYEGPDDSGNSLYPENGGSSAVVVPMRRGDAVLAELGVDHIDACKIDVEGAELAVLRGLAGTLRRRAIRWLNLEINHPACAAAGHAAEDLVALLAGWGYTMTPAAQERFARPGWSLDDFQFVPVPEDAAARSGGGGAGGAA